MASLECWVCSSRVARSYSSVALNSFALRANSSTATSAASTARFLPFFLSGTPGGAGCATCSGSESSSRGQTPDGRCVHAAREPVP